MIEFSSDKKQLKISIPVSSLLAANKYYQSIINVLDTIDIDDCNQNQKEDLIIIYELLSHLQCDEEFLLQHSELRKEENQFHKNILA